MNFLSAPERIVIATRKSRLALWQAEHVRELLLRCYPSCCVELLGITTRGDRILDRPLAKIGGKGLFVKELETALLDGSADIAAHSMKDVPMALAPEFAIAAICQREVPLDAFVSNKYATLDDMPPGSVVGTSSLRREAQLRARYPHLAVKGLRGNLDTRLSKLDAGEYDAIILAAAGLIRLGLSGRIRAALPAGLLLPAAGQGALGIETLSSRSELRAWLAPLNDPATSACVHAERAMSRALGGGCEVPLGAFAQIQTGAANELRLRGFVAMPDGKRVISAESTVVLTDTADKLEVAEALGLRVADELCQQGANGIISSLFHRSTGMRPDAGALSGRYVVVTRPAGQAGHLAGLIEAAGGIPVLFPVLEIRDIEDRRPLLELAARLDSFDLAVFVSPNAVCKALPVIMASRSWPSRLRVAAMGGSSERELAQYGFSEVIAPRHIFDSESLLALPELQDMSGKRVIVFRGDSGREWLGDTLAERGATVEHVECYRRVKSDLDVAPLLYLWRRGDLGESGAVTITSSEALRHLHHMIGLPGQRFLSKTPLFASHARIVSEAQKLGLRRVFQTSAGDDGLLAGMINYFVTDSAIKPHGH